MNKKTFLLIMLLIFSALSVNARNLNLELDYPTFGEIDLNTNQGLDDLTVWFYSFIVSISGLAAFAKLLQGGFSWLTSTGNPSKTAKARETIQSALIGLLIVLGSYIIIETLNPELLEIRLPIFG